MRGAMERSGEDLGLGAMGQALLKTPSSQLRFLKCDAFALVRNSAARTPGPAVPVCLLGAAHARMRLGLFDACCRR